MCGAGSRETCQLPNGHSFIARAAIARRGKDDTAPSSRTERIAEPRQRERNEPRRFVEGVRRWPYSCINFIDPSFVIVRRWRD